MPKYIPCIFIADTLTVNVSVLLLSLASPDESSLVSHINTYTQHTHERTNDRINERNAKENLVCPLLSPPVELKKNKIAICYRKK